MVCCLWSSGRGRRMLCKLLVESSARSRMYVYELGRMSLRPQICWYTGMSGRMKDVSALMRQNTERRCLK